ncbi:bifunctional nicotinamidase/pyrazinamidase [Escherichia coli]|nr:nicotinamidase/pyrazinamidase [Escherichia coli]
MPPRALLLVDLQNDFCAGGALAVPEGDSTVDVANRLIDWCQSRGEAVLHPLLHQKAIAAVFHKGENPLVDSYSAFFDNGRRQKTSLDDWLRDHEIDELIVMGLATDYCVKFTVLDALQLGYKVNVITDGCRGVNIQPQDSAHAFMEMSAAGATLYTLADWEETQG